MSNQLSTHPVLIRTSLAWLRGVFVNANASQLQDANILGVPLLINGELKPEVVALLTTASFYTRVFCAIFPSESLPAEGDNVIVAPTFWPVIHGLARRGVYAVEEGGETVNHAALAQKAPFRESSHLAIIDALMTAYVSSVVTIPHIVRAVRQISALNAAHELPSTVEEALLLWLRKVSEAVSRAFQEPTVMKRGAREQLWRRESVVARPRSLVEAIAGGQSLPALLVHYWHHEFKINDLFFKATQLTHEEAIQNITRFSSFAEANLPPCTFHILPEILTNKDIISSLHTNMLALLARLYDFFEPCASSAVNKGKPTGGGVAHRTVSDTELKLSSWHKLPSFSEVSCAESKKMPMRQYKHKPLLPLRHRQAESVLTGDDPNNQVNAPSLSKSLSSFSSPALTSCNVIFKPLIVSSKSVKKAGSSLITPSVDRLGLMETREGVVSNSEVKSETIRKSGERGVGWQKVCKEYGESMTALHLTPQEHNSSQHKTRASDSTTCGEHHSTRSVNVQPEMAFSTLEGSSPIVCCPEVQKSFTLSTQHTAASASEAGLPIIQSQPIISEKTSRFTEEESSTVLSRVKHAQNCIPGVRLTKPEPATSQLSLDTNCNTVVVYTSKSMVKGECVFDQYLLRHLQNDIAGNELNMKRQMWRQRLKEKIHMHKAMCTCVCSSDSAAKITNAVTDSVVTESHPALTSPSVPSQQLPVLTSTTSKIHDTVTAVSLLDPQTNIPLTPISTPPTDVETPVQYQGEGNPWSLRTFTPNTPHKEMATSELQVRRQNLLREKITKRQHERKMAKEHRKREKIIRDIRAFTDDKSSDIDKNTVSVSLTKSKVVATPSPAPSSLYSPQPPPFITHNGPECYVKPSAKSNRKLIRNALCHVCLAGDVNLPAKQRALTELDTSDALHFFILFKRVISFVFRALYSYSEEGKVMKIFGSGPKTIQKHMVDHYYKYNSGSKGFSKVHSHSFSLSVDAFTLKQEVWASRRPKPS